MYEKHLFFSALLSGRDPEYPAGSLVIYVHARCYSVPEFSLNLLLHTRFDTARARNIGRI